MFRWNLMLRTLFGSTHQLSKARRPRMVEPHLEELTPRILPSASPLPIVSVASPPPVPSVSAITSYVEATMNQWTQLLVTVQQDISIALYTVGQLIAQEVSAFEQQWDRLLGIAPPASNPSLPSATAQLSSDSGPGQGHASGSGSGSGATTTAHDNPHPRLDASADVSSGSGTASGSGPYSGSATVTGQIWLDNNGDGSIDNNEMDYSGATVDLDVSTDGGSTWSIQTSTTTSAATQGYNYSLRVGYGYPWPSSYLYKVQVAIPANFEATIPGTSQIDAQGFSQVFSLSPGAVQIIIGGLASMTVNTTDDDPSGPTQQNTVTLRDAMQTGNNGGGILGLTNITFTGNGANGVIIPEAALPAITRSYNIVGPGSSSLTVDGQKDPATIFTVNSAVTSTISGLTITDGSQGSGNGGGVLNNGNLTLNSDMISYNDAPGNGGGIYNGSGTLKLSGDNIWWNSAAGAGGGLYNAGGTVTITGGTVIMGNKAPDTTTGGGGGIYNNGSGTVTVSGGTVISTNSTGTSGGGVKNLGTFYMTGGQISKNTAPPTTGSGGGVQNLGSMRLLGVQVQGNSAGKGGGIFTTGGKLVLGQNTTVSGNTTSGTSSGGAGIWVQSGTAALVGGGVTNNTAQLDGGGIYVYGGQLMLSSGVKVTGNYAVGSTGVAWGGGIFIRSGKVTVSGGTIGSNQATWYSGGGIYNFGGTLTLDDSVNIYLNGANNDGGGIYLAAPSTTTFNNAAVYENRTNGNQQTTGWGVYWQNGATVNPPINLYDPNDPNGKPVQGP